MGTPPSEPRETACVVIPVYKKGLDHTEKIALDRAFDMFAEDHSVTFVAPEGLRAEALARKEAPVLRFDSSYFEDRQGYNDLLLSKEFYRSFLRFEYVLIHQLDAYAFSDQLPDWCRRGIDYIGAPWFEGFGQASSDGDLWVGGNGGFSLRRVRACLRVLDRVTTFNIAWTALHSRVADFHPTCWWNIPLLFRNQHLCLGAMGNEDVFWAMYAPQIDNAFRVGTIEESLDFAFEAQPQVMYAKNNEQLPFGCHAWEKHNPEFWSSFIEGEW